METRFQSLEAVEPVKFAKQTATTKTFHVDVKKQSVVCKGKNFKNALSWKNQKRLKNLNLNCLVISHNAFDCKSTFKCFKCNRGHDILLHTDNDVKWQEPSKVAVHITNKGQVLLPTAQIRVAEKNKFLIISNVLKDIPQEDKDFIADIEFSEDKTIKSLGVPWNAVKDTFRIKVSVATVSEVATKQQSLFEAAKMFDPLRLLSPITMSIKIIFQEIWMNGIAWDDRLSTDITTQ